MRVIIGALQGIPFHTMVGVYAMCTILVFSKIITFYLHPLIIHIIRIRSTIFKAFTFLRNIIHLDTLLNPSSVIVYARIVADISSRKVPVLAHFTIHMVEIIQLYTYQPRMWLGFRHHPCSNHMYGWTQSQIH